MLVVKKPDGDGGWEITAKVSEEEFLQMTELDGELIFDENYPTGGLLIALGRLANRRDTSRLIAESLEREVHIALTCAHGVPALLCSVCLPIQSQREEAAA